MKYNSGGFILLDKEVGISSFKAVQRVRNTLKIKKGGHGGTLDVAASGLLIIGLKFSTKLLEYVIGLDKVYDAEITFGLLSDTLDLDGTILKNIPSSPDILEIENSLKKFTGIIEQVPPIYSALKENGKTLYKLARDGKTVDLEKKRRKIEIYSIEILDYLKEYQSRLKIRVHCSSGTYIRSLARDIGRSLNEPAVLSSLVRKKIGNFFIEDSVVLEKLSLSDIIKPDVFLEKLDFKKYSLNDVERVRFLNGNFIKTSEMSYDRIYLIDNENNFLGTGKIVDGGVLKPVKVCKQVI